MKNTLRTSVVGMEMKCLAFAIPALGGLLLGHIPACAQEWTQTSAPTLNWKGVGCSVDGSNLVAVADYGPIHTSTNSGTTWTTNAPFTTYLVSVASSADGTSLAASSYDWVHNYGNIYASTNSGTIWTNNPLFALALALSADGTKLVAAATGGYMGPGAIHTSTNSGAGWAPTSAPVTNWSAVASSADGTKLFAAASRLGGPFWSSVEGPIYVSTDSGVTWTATSSPSRVWPSIACSADGTKLVAAGNGSIYTATDSGAAWTSNSATSLGWTSVASSADGSRLVAAASGAYPDYAGAIFISTNSGASWAATGAPGTNWTSVASSADGSKLVAVVNGGGVYTSQSTPTPSLSITPSGRNAVLSWIVPSTGFVLQQNADLSTTNWADVTNTPTLNLTNLRYEVSVSATPGNVFYRLKSL